MNRGNMMFLIIETPSYIVKTGLRTGIVVYRLRLLLWAQFYLLKV